MLPQNVFSLLIKNSDKLKLQDVLFKYASLGLNVWFISPQPFNQLPSNLIPPDKEVLQLITFLYLQDQADLLSHLNSVHLWTKYPQVIIVNDYEFYCGDSLRLNAFIIASMLDATLACARRHHFKRAHFVTSFTRECTEFENIFCMYFRKILSYDDNEDDLLQLIKDDVLLK
ncbi:uncharacterized protein LOC116181260 isoform X2 [Photinus pyralis]|uniref:uncharacterized protein LOC116181260 isoform X2 n=1 Tax=Photinus pyralis TaxID=7054 RepID=UPI0012671CB0|nr:uncharacterized protein LOC116181260 isoform X2 [Photinus pyralis]